MKKSNKSNKLTIKYKSLSYIQKHRNKRVFHNRNLLIFYHNKHFYNVYKPKSKINTNEKSFKIH